MLRYVLEMKQTLVLVALSPLRTGLSRVQCTEFNGPYISRRTMRAGEVPTVGFVIRTRLLWVYVTSVFMEVRILLKPRRVSQ
jgi:hypothetical protein